jgi:hypothetical protein
VGAVPALYDSPDTVDDFFGLVNRSATYRGRQVGDEGVVKMLDAAGEHLRSLGYKSSSVDKDDLIAKLLNKQEEMLSPDDLETTLGNTVTQALTKGLDLVDKRLMSLGLMPVPGESPNPALKKKPRPGSFPGPASFPGPGSASTRASSSFGTPGTASTSTPVLPTARTLFLGEHEEDDEEYEDIEDPAIAAQKLAVDHLYNTIATGLVAAGGGLGPSTHCKYHESAPLRGVPINMCGPNPTTPVWTIAENNILDYLAAVPMDLARLALDYIPMAFHLYKRVQKPGARMVVILRTYGMVFTIELKKEYKLVLLCLCWARSNKDLTNCQAWHVQNEAECIAAETVAAAAAAVPVVPGPPAGPNVLIA